MNLTEKYGIKMKYNQFADIVSENFEDSDEKIAIDLFEKCVLDLKEKNKTKYNMIELGSNYSYYSMLFKKIIEPNKSFNLLLEPYEKYMKTGKEHFEINNLEGVFLEERIYNPTPWCDITFTCPTTTIDELMDRYEIDELDILHSDIDKSEVYALDSAKHALENKKIDTLFIMTHPQTPEEGWSTEENPTQLHLRCKEILFNYGYTLVYDHPRCDLAGDGMLVFKK
jgi:hypothetical protein